MSVTPGAAGAPLKVDVTSGQLASNLPILYAPTTAAAAASGQRLVAPDRRRCTRPQRRPSSRPS